jgi:CheY-like chemotaxis protein
MTQKRRVMVIEDDADTVELLRVILELKGYEPVSALGGAEGLRLLREEGPVDLVLLDLMMDDMDGWSVLKAIKEDESLCHIPVIILSVRHQLEDTRRTKAYEGQFVDYVVKPFNLEELVETIAKHLA